MKTMHMRTVITIIKINELHCNQSKIMVGV